MPAEARQPFTIDDALSIRSLADRCPIRLSPDGGLIAYSVEQFQQRHRMREETWVADLATGQAHRILPEAMAAWGPSWAPRGQQLAFYADVGDGLHLWVWEADTGKARRVSPAVVAGDYRFDVAQWTPDASGVVCKLASPTRLAHYTPSGKPITREERPSVEEADSLSVRCWESRPATEVPDSGTGEGAVADGRADWWSCGTLAWIDAITGNTVPLVEDTSIRGWAISPHSQQVALMRLAGRDQAGVSLGLDLCVVPARGGKVRALDRVAHSYGISFSWSPDSRLVAYRSGRDVTVVSITDGHRRMLKQFGPEDINDEMYEAPLWSPDQSFVLVTEQQTIWRIPTERGEPVDLLPERGSLRVDGIVAPDGGPVLWSPDQAQTVVAVVCDTKSNDKGLARVDLGGGGVRKMWTAPCRVAEWPRFSSDACPGRNLIAFVREDATHPEDIWLTDADFSEPRQVTVTNPHVQDVAFSAPQLMDWVGPDGIGYRCAFFPPPDRCGPPPYPTIFLAYDGRISGSYSAFGFQGPHCDNIQVFTSHGYAVCGTDVVVSDESPAKSIRELLNAAVKAVVAQGLADPKRLGIIGNSYGGYIVNVALTGLECFAAAVSDTGMANLSSAYGLTTPEGEAAYIGWLESAGLGRMDAPPWEKPERYVENSPIFSLDHVTTPVLIIHGSADPAIPQAWELFSGLCRLGKIAELVVYEGEGHWQGEWRRANVIDRWQRVLGWFDKYLGPERDA